MNCRICGGKSICFIGGIGPLCDECHRLSKHLVRPDRFFGLYHFLNELYRLRYEYDFFLGASVAQENGGCRQ